MQKIKPLAVPQLRAGEIPYIVDRPERRSFHDFKVRTLCPIQAAGVYVRLGTSLVVESYAANEGS